MGIKEKEKITKQNVVLRHNVVEEERISVSETKRYSIIIIICTALG